jgi:hypothetical protein
MFYFFQRGSEYIRCEISGTSETGFTIVITEPGGLERVEQFRSSDAVHERWLSLQEHLVKDGWWGPHGRD